MNQLVNEPAKSITIIIWIISFLAFEFYGIHNFSLKGRGGVRILGWFKYLGSLQNWSVNQLTSWLVESLIPSPWISWVNEAVKSIILLLPPIPPLPSPSLSSSSSISYLIILFLLFPPPLFHPPPYSSPAGYGYSCKAERPQSRWQSDHNCWYIAGKVHRPGDTEPLGKQDSVVQSGYTGAIANTTIVRFYIASREGCFLVNQDT